MKKQTQLFGIMIWICIALSACGGTNIGDETQVNTEVRPTLEVTEVTSDTPITSTNATSEPTENAVVYYLYYPKDNETNTLEFRQDVQVLQNAAVAYECTKDNIRIVESLEGLTYNEDDIIIVVKPYDLTDIEALMQELQGQEPDRNIVLLPEANVPDLGPYSRSESETRFHNLPKPLLNFLNDQAVVGVVCDVGICWPPLEPDPEPDECVSNSEESPIPTDTPTPAPSPES
jgi:hypothetical protein